MITFLATHDDNGGTQILWEKIAGEIQSRGIAANFLAIYTFEDVKKPSWESASDSPLKLRNSPFVLHRLMRILKRRRTRTTISALPLANVFNAIISPLSGVRVRITTHHSPVDTYNPLLRWLDRILGSTRCITHIVCVSDGVRQSLSHYPSSYLAKTVVIRNALSDEIKSTIALLSRDRGEAIVNRPARLVALGRLAAQKNYSTLITAMSYVENAVLEICGDGPDREALEHLRDRLGLQQAVVFRGHVNHEDALALASQADVFLQPSLFEGHSIALLEAAELGLPLIVSDAPTQVEAIRLPDHSLAGIVVPALDARALANAINDVLSCPEQLRTLSAASSQLARETTFSELVTEYLRLTSEARAGLKNVHGRNE